MYTAYAQINIGHGGVNNPERISTQENIDNSSKPERKKWYDGEWPVAQGSDSCQPSSWLPTMPGEKNASDDLMSNNDFDSFWRCAFWKDLHFGKSKQEQRFYQHVQSACDAVTSSPLRRSIGKTTVNAVRPSRSNPSVAPQMVLINRQCNWCSLKAA